MLECCRQHGFLVLLQSGIVLEAVECEHVEEEVRCHGDDIFPKVAPLAVVLRLLVGFQAHRGYGDNPVHSAKQKL